MVGNKKIEEEAFKSGATLMQEEFLKKGCNQ